eukprot:13777887-Heterocapsa_arctica.AAC.1
MHPDAFVEGAPVTNLTKSFQCGLLADDIEAILGYTRVAHAANEMNTGQFLELKKARFLQWFDTEDPTFDQVVHNNPARAAQLV